MGYRGRHKARSRFHFLFVILCCLALLMLAYPFLEPVSYTHLDVSKRQVW